MRDAILLLSLGLLLVACKLGSPSNQDAGTGGEGGEGSQSCSRCGQVMLEGASSAALCTASSILFEKITACACGAGPCSAECYESVCSGVGAIPACASCMMVKCPPDFAWCSNDMSTQ